MQNGLGTRLGLGVHASKRGCKAGPRKVREWVKEIMDLSKIASTQPHAAYSAFTHGLSSHWAYISRTIPDIQDLLRPLEMSIHQHFIPALTGREACSAAERDLLALPVRLGGMGLVNPMTESTHAFEASKHITASLVALIMSQDPKQGCAEGRSPENKEPREKKEKGATRTASTGYSWTAESTAPTFDRASSRERVISMAHSSACG